MGGTTTAVTQNQNQQLHYQLRSAVFSLACIFSKIGSFVFRFVPVCFFHSYLFSTTSPLRFPVCSGLFFVHFSLFSTTSPVRFSKKVFFFVFAPNNWQGKWPWFSSQSSYFTGAHSSPATEKTAGPMMDRALQTPRLIP
ncbi:MAG TPA: hypothetical protein VFQ24_08425 [Terriglobia bacterium]|nr:hypothetical protein [Terriglobia bacterium]